MRRRSRNVIKASERTETWRVWLVVALWTLFIAQFAVDTQSRSAGSAPYPIITMPAFSADDVGTDGRARVTVRTIHVINSDGTGRTVDVGALLAPLHTGPASSTLDRLLKPSNPVSPEPTQESVQWLRAQTERLGLTPDPVGLRVVWQPTELDTRTGVWTPAGEPTVREVRW